MNQIDRRTDVRFSRNRRARAAALDASSAASGRLHQVVFALSGICLAAAALVACLS